MWYMSLSFVFFTLAMVILTSFALVALPIVRTNFKPIPKGHKMRQKSGILLYYQEWNRCKQSGMTKDEESKLMYGMLFSLKSFVTKISPLDVKEGFQYYKTSKYTLHYLETPSGLKFVINTDNSAQGVKEVLQQIYNQIYVEYVVKNPLAKMNEPIESELFKSKLDIFVKSSPIYISKTI